MPGDSIFKVAYIFELVEQVVAPGAGEAVRAPAPARRASMSRRWSRPSLDRTRAPSLIEQLPRESPNDALRRSSNAGRLAPWLARPSTSGTPDSPRPLLSGSPVPARNGSRVIELEGDVFGSLCPAALERSISQQRAP